MPPTERLTAALAGIAMGAASMVVCGGAASWFLPAAARQKSAGEKESAPSPALEDVDELRRLYKRDGFVKLSGLLTAEEVESWRAALDTAVQDQLLRSQGTYSAQQVSLSLTVSR